MEYIIVSEVTEVISIYKVEQVIYKNIKQNWTQDWILRDP